MMTSTGSEDAATQFTVRMFVVAPKRKRSQWGAGQCVVTLGGFPIDAIVVVKMNAAGLLRKHITSRAGAERWLVEHGLQRTDAIGILDHPGDYRSQEMTFSFKE